MEEFEDEKCAKGARTNICKREDIFGDTIIEAPTFSIGYIDSKPLRDLNILARIFSTIFPKLHMRIELSIARRK